MSISRLEPQFVETFPAMMEPGVLYVSLEYLTSGHLCACGCGNEVTTPISPAQWSFTFDGRNISLCPSVGNWTLPCRSHYIVDRSRVRWSHTFTDAEIELNRRRDRAALATGGLSDSGRTCNESFVDDADFKAVPVAFWRRVRSQIVALAKTGKTSTRTGHRRRGSWPKR